ncbi:MAG: hypothetical protein HQL72_06415 [Magnetococcales bacterium]|nr:hypothetical protein [Magnetococcales bacterium]
MELTNLQKIVGGIVMVVIVGFAVFMAMDDLKNSKKKQGIHAIEAPVVVEPMTK